jgi:hypothetical protein
MLLAPQARAASVGFMAGWLVGIVVTLVAFVLLAAVIPEQDDDASQPGLASSRSCSACSCC